MTTPSPSTPSLSFHSHQAMTTPMAGLAYKPFKQWLRPPNWKSPQIFDDPYVIYIKKKKALFFFFFSLFLSRTTLFFSLSLSVSFSLHVYHSITPSTYRESASLSILFFFLFTIFFSAFGKSSS